MRQKKVLIFTNSQDVHADLIIPKIEKLGGKSFRVDTDKLHINSLISLDYNKKVSAPQIQIDNKSVSVNGIFSIWIRRPFEFPSEPESAKQKFIRLELIDGLRGIISIISKDKLIVDHPYKLAKARNKLFQLHLSNKIGLKTPKTLYTNNPSEAKQFCKDHNFNVIVKSIGLGHAVTEKEVFAVYTTKINKNVDFSLVKNCPTLFQEQIKKKTELRITIVGKKVFAVEFDSQKFPEGRIDWRKSVDRISEIPHRVVKLPVEIENKLLELLDYYGLNFGAIDMARTSEDKYIFFELNPAGQFLWLEELTNLPLAYEMAKFLLGKPN